MTAYQQGRADWAPNDANGHFHELCLFPLESAPWIEYERGWEDAAAEYARDMAADLFEEA